MMWTTTVLLLLLPHLLSSADKGNSGDFNQSEIGEEDFFDAPVKAQKPVGEVRGRDTCSIPCDITVKLLRDEKHSICGQLQQSLLAFGRSTRKLIRDVMEEQQRALDILSSQVTELMTKVQTLSSEVQRSNTEMYSIKPVQSHGRDCSDIKDNLMPVVPKIPSGIYIIHPDNIDSSFEVFCEMDYMGGGWTVMQRRTDGLTDFKRPWADYVDGFGHLAGEHWLGLKKVFHIVNQKDTRFQLHIALVSHDDVTSYASYDDFRLDNETQFFSIQLGRYAGSAGDAFRGYDQDQNQDTAPFSASDVDNDGCNPFCSIGNSTVESCSIQQNQTGWWFNQCGLANLNGSPEDPEQNQGQRTHILWDTWRQKGVPHTIKSVTMKIRRIATNN
ncbi:angiopoietin-related protein 5 isoform X1 [Acanthochromis polyacanthus]|uniref:angiopoietin-related protein 5 isoform X1 n=1 Tax=Acanthochromis polyacanthus TaxID=80966 RepID=UPI000B8FA4BE|nr:angiopoietin-related protein 5 isoform X1 [Acanthochromis polyacanthus]